VALPRFKHNEHGPGPPEDVFAQALAQALAPALAQVMPKAMVQAMAQVGSETVSPAEPGTVPDTGPQAAPGAVPDTGPPAVPEATSQAMSEAVAKAWSQAVIEAVRQARARTVVELMDKAMSNWRKGLVLTTMVCCPLALIVGGVVATVFAARGIRLPEYVLPVGYSAAGIVLAFCGMALGRITGTRRHPSASSDERQIDKPLPSQTHGPSRKLQKRPRLQYPIAQSAPFPRR
jgi:hypothetical protein